MSITLFPLRSAVLDELAAVIGPMETLRLSIRFGSRSIRVPKRVPARSPLLEVIRPESVELLVRRFGGCTLAISAAPGRRARIVELRKRRMSGRQIVEIIGCTERFVWQVLAEYRRLGGSLESTHELTDQEIGIVAETRSTTVFREVGSSARSDDESEG